MEKSVSLKELFLNEFGLEEQDIRTYSPLTLSYIGLFFYSQTDPGEFIPLPFGHFAIIIFILLECRCEKNLAFSASVQSPAFLLGYAKEKKAKKRQIDACDL
jgi:hypothetical protein